MPMSPVNDVVPDVVAECEGLPPARSGVFKILASYLSSALLLPKPHRRFFSETEGQKKLPK